MVAGCKGYSGWCVGVPVGVARRPNECGKLLCMSPLCVRLRRSAIDHVCQAALGNITYQPAPAARLLVSPLPPSSSSAGCTAKCSCLCLLSLPAYFAIFLISLMDLCAALATLAQSCPPLYTPSAPSLHPLLYSLCTPLGPLKSPPLTLIPCTGCFCAQGCLCSLWLCWPSSN